MKATLTKSTPSSYGFSTTRDGSQPVLLIHPDIINNTPTIQDSNERILKIRKAFKFDEFHHKMLSLSGFGFNRCLLPSMTDAGYYKFKPASGFYFTPTYKGWRKLNQLIGSFSVLLDHLNKQPCVNVSNKPQLMYLDIDINYAGHWCLNADLESTFTEWISGYHPKSLTEVKGEMQFVWNYLRNTNRQRVKGFRAHVVYENGYLKLSCPHQCELKPDPPVNTSEGYRVKSHNIHNGIELLTLLAGLTKLENLVQENI